jgi:hypothetical protein
MQRPRIWVNGQLVQLLRSTTQGVSSAVSSWVNTVAQIINGGSSSSPSSSPTSSSSGSAYVYNSGTQQVSTLKVCKTQAMAAALTSAACLTCRFLTHAPPAGLA